MNDLDGVIATLLANLRPMLSHFMAWWALPGDVQTALIVLPLVVVALVLNDRNYRLKFRVGLAPLEWLDDSI